MPKKEKIVFSVTFSLSLTIFFNRLDMDRYTNLLKLERPLVSNCFTNIETCHPTIYQGFVIIVKMVRGKHSAFLIPSFRKNLSRRTVLVNYPPPNLHRSSSFWDFVITEWVNGRVWIWDKRRESWWASILHNRITIVENCPWVIAKK